MADLASSSASPAQAATPSPSVADSPEPSPRGTLSESSLNRTQSGQARIDEILETGARRAESYGGAQSPRLQPLLRGETTASIAEHEDGDGDGNGHGDDHDGVETRQPERQRSLNYQTLTRDTQPRQRGSIRRKSSSQQQQQQQRRRQQQQAEHPGGADDSSRQSVRPETRWTTFLQYFRSIELENKGSVARDHLALERTFLAWLRTSLAFASIGIAITQLFRLNTTLQGSAGNETLKHLGRPLGTTFLAISILILFLGYQRYLEGQYWVMRGKFPASRGTIMIVAFVALAVTVASLVVVIVVQPAPSTAS